MLLFGLIWFPKFTVPVQVNLSSNIDFGLCLFAGLLDDTHVRKCGERRLVEQILRGKILHIL